MSIFTHERNDMPRERLDNDEKKTFAVHKRPILLAQEDTTGMGRPFECAFCKRGFTNAQALGGHMNIHRKDRLAKQQPSRYHPQTDHLQVGSARVDVEREGDDHVNVDLELRLGHGRW